MFKNKDLTIPRTFAYVYTIVQAALALIWMGGNIAVFYTEKLSLNYIEAAKTMVVDDYMGILYALFLSPIVFVTSNTAIIHAVVSFAQTILVLGSFLYLNSVLFKYRLGRRDRIVLSVFATTIPFVVQAECTVLPNALGLCLFVLFFANIHNLYNDPKIADFVLLLALCALITLLFADYYVVAVLMLVPVIGYMLINRKLTALLYTGSAVLVLTIMLFVSHGICTPESYGRVERSFLIYLNQRITMPHLGDGAGIIKEYCGLDNNDFFKAAINIPEKYFEDYLMTVKEACGGTIPSELLVSLMEKSILQRTRSVFMAIVKDIAFGALPVFSVIYIYLRHTTETVMSINIIRFLRELPTVSKAFLVLFETGFIMAGVIAFVDKLRQPEEIVEVKPEQVSLHYMIYVIIVFSVYFAFFSFYGFDYRNVLFAISTPAIIVFSKLLTKRNHR